MWLHSPGHEWAGQVPAAQRTQEGNGVLRAEVGSEEEEGSWGTENQHRQLPQLHHGGMKEQGRKEQGLWRLTSLSLDPSPICGSLLHFMSPLAGGYGFPEQCLNSVP